MLSNDQYIDQPREVSLETFAFCNARCTFCPYPQLARKGTRMSTHKIFSLIAEMSEFKVPFAFSPFKVNEPFLDDRLQEICESFLEHCAVGELRLFTNGSVLTRTNVEWVGQLSRVQHLWISLNSVDAEEYHQLMGLQLEITLRRLDDLHRLLFMGWPHAVVVSRVAMPDAERNRQFVVTCRERWPLFDVRLLKPESWLGDIDAQRTYVPQTPCARWFELSILATGVAALCCMDSTGAYAIGDVNTHSLLWLYNQPFFRDRRLGIVSRTRYNPCRGCTY